ncbi:hypothetical protein KGO95_02450 [Patescibacteria group bacterium]|nr:hypothetical protein [Patescibacteria group bacterium]
MTWINISNWLLNNAPALVISVMALVISIKSWYKTRVYYDLEMYTIAGSAGNVVNQLDAVRQKLNTGKYTIINTFEETYQANGFGRNRVNILIGKVKQ